MARIETRIEQRAENARIAWITVDDSRRLNVLDEIAIASLTDAFRRLAEEPALRAAVLSGAGERAFIGGADVTGLARLTPASAEGFIAGLHELCVALRALPLPVIAAIRGYCLGGGLEIALCCDLRIAAADAVFGLPEVKLGIPSVIEAALLPRQIGRGRAARLIYTGETIDAATALDWGLVEEVSPVADLGDAVERLLSSLLNAGAEALRLQKAVLRQWDRLPLEAACASGIAEFAAAYGSGEPQALMHRFLARKRG